MAFVSAFLPRRGSFSIRSSCARSPECIFSNPTRRRHFVCVVHKEVPGSSRSELEGAKKIGPLDENERFEVTVRLRRKADLEGHDDRSFMGDVLPKQRVYIDREQYEKSYGADDDDVEKVVEFAHDYDLEVVNSSVARRSVLLSGSAKNLCKAFGTTIGKFEHEGALYRLRRGPITVPEALEELVEGVFGLDNRPCAEPHYVRRDHGVKMETEADQAFFTAVDLAKLYNFPRQFDGSGECIGIIELGGGFRNQDIDAYFKKLDLPIPDVVAIPVDGESNNPDGLTMKANGEVMLDIEVAAGIAPRAKIAVYFAPNTEQGFIDAVTTAIHDSDNRPSVISISWGAAELYWTEQGLLSFNAALQSAAALGVTICCASGDSGSGDQNPPLLFDGLPHVDFPGSSPFSLCCGGTTLIASDDAISAETVWNNDPVTSASGGGVSSFFALPEYQSSAGVPQLNKGESKFAGRGVPDVAGDADPNTAYLIRVDGVETVIGGTSAVAPLWAGLIALMNQSLGTPVGFLNPIIYSRLGGTSAFHDITEGNNGAYNAGPGWDPCTGWGSPNGEKFLNELS
jgi:kumamolisin